MKPPPTSGLYGHAQGTQCQPVLTAARETRSNYITSRGRVELLPMPPANERLMCARPEPACFYGGK